MKFTSGRPQTGSCRNIDPKALKRYGVQFKSGIRPLWEDESNRDGGRWSIRVKRHNTDRYWENAIMAMIGEQFMVGNEICGMQLSLRYPYDQVAYISSSTANSNGTYI